MKKFRFLEHTGDIKFQAYGTSLEKAFANSALAMFAAMHDGEVKKVKKIKIKTNGKDLESLLYNFLEELLIVFDTEGFFLGKVKSLKISKKEGKFRLEAEVIGDKADKYEIHIDIKAITYNDMFIEKGKEKWICQVVIDV
jgi:SHS2 domain-containing protein